MNIISNHNCWILLFVYVKKAFVERQYRGWAASAMRKIKR